ncbi:gamma-glutamyltransferase family protein [Jiangella alkaliphila]|uniref:Gamma-glutamyltranspeptidase / glutathione hydrolase n=1 Tax=Jiangella alkaliphila TaxID=419479 RepID=A0A1H2JDN7_9ACTN|nr:gamma-glutamyltransferase [Jiangella alkaliphila]SDU54218.1 gamma-glutamyltranspeptidase / glutathione hydrolase [Jiangella alkaliphila]
MTGSPGGVVATSHTLSTRAGVQILQAGGNAVDAAIAACAVQGVVAPETCGVGGDLFALVHLPGHSTPLALNSSGRAGSGVDAAALRAAGLDEIPRAHPAAIPVPGCVDGWATLSSRLGKLGLAAVLEPAVRLASEGFPANDELVAAFRASAASLAGVEAAAPMLAASRGATVVRSQLAATLRLVADGGRAAFYEGAPGRAISAAVDGVITADDLRHDQADWVDPLSVDVWGSTGWTVPPNSQGYLGIGGCAVLERLGWADDPADPQSWHLQIEAQRALAADRDDLAVDPGRVPVPLDRLLDAARLDTVAASVDPGAARERHSAAPAAGGTAYLCVVDGDGMAVSLIQSNFHGIGSLVGAGAAGFLLHDRGRGFSLIPDHPGELAPGRRPLHTLSPSLWTRGERLAMVLGARGGHVQPQLVQQVAAFVLGAGLDPDEAQARPRWTIEPPEGPTGAPVPSGSRVRVEPDVPARVVDGLRRRGHEVVPVDGPQPGWGPVSVIQVDDAGWRLSARDPRVATTAVATA